MNEELVKSLRDAEHFAESRGYYGMAKVIQQAAESIEELQRLVDANNTFRWVSVEERLPEDYKMVIGYTPCDGYMFVGFHRTSVYRDYNWSAWYIVTAMRSKKKMTKKVTHWVPLPEPPKEE